MPTPSSKLRETLRARLRDLAKLAKKPAPRGPASKASITRLERKIGRALPEFYRNLLSIHDGWYAAGGVLTLRGTSKLLERDEDDEMPSTWVLVGFLHDEDTQYYLRPRKRDGWTLVEVHHASGGSGLTGAITLSKVLDRFERSLRHDAVRREESTPMAPAVDSAELRALFAEKDRSATAQRIAALLGEGRWFDGASGPLLSRVESLVARRKFAEAEVLLSAGLARIEGPTLELVERLLAALCNANRPEAVVRLGTAAIRTLRPFFTNFYHRGWGRMKLGDLPGAIEDYEASLALNPSSEASNNLAHCLHRLGRDREAMKYAKQAVKLNPHNGPGLETLAEICAAVGDKAGSVLAVTAARRVGVAIDVDAIAPHLIPRRRS